MNYLYGVILIQIINVLSLSFDFSYMIKYSPFVDCFELEFEKSKNYFKLDLRNQKIKLETLDNAGLKEPLINSSETI